MVGQVSTSFVVLTALVCTTQAAGQYNAQQQQYSANRQTFQAPAAAYGNSYNSAYKPQQQYQHQGGYGKGYGYEEKRQEHPAKYQFHWNVKDGPSYNNYYHNEAREGDNTYGEYGVLLPDGRYQTVKYTVDKWGYKADVQYQGEAKYEQPKSYDKQQGYQQPLQQAYQPQPSVPYGGYRQQQSKY